MKRLLPLVAALALLPACGCSGKKPPPPEAPHPPPVASAAPHEVTYEDEWQKTAFGGAYLAPKDGFPNGEVDLVFHFHAGKFADKEYREIAGPIGVVVRLDYGVGTQPYEDAFKDPNRFQSFIDDTLAELHDRYAPDGGALRIRRLSLFAWSAGYASIRKILQQRDYYDRVDTVVLLDGLHTNYVEKVPKGAVEHGIPFPHHVDVRTLAPFTRLAEDAAAGKKEFVFTHSSIVPPGYASTTETAAALEELVHAKKVEERVPGPGNLVRLYEAGVGDFHVRGFTGETKESHIAHLHMIDDVVKDFVAPRWARLDKVPGAPVSSPASP